MHANGREWLRTPGQPAVRVDGRGCGWQSWGMRLPTECARFFPEPELYRQWLESWEFDQIRILDLGLCRNTRDEAVRTAELAEEHGWSQLLLVTSASHMKRSEAAFRKFESPNEGRIPNGGHRTFGSFAIRA
jgi:uncharacterized SAM-binding protein YcdF (DUF218 family)